MNGEAMWYPTHFCLRVPVMLISRIDGGYCVVQDMKGQNFIVKHWYLKKLYPNQEERVLWDGHLTLRQGD